MRHTNRKVLLLPSLVSAELSDSLADCGEYTRQLQANKREKYGM